MSFLDGEFEVARDVVEVDIEPKFPPPVADRLDLAAVASREAVDATHHPQVTGPVLQLSDPGIEIVGPDNLDQVSTPSDRAVWFEANPRSSGLPTR